MRVRENGTRALEHWKQKKIKKKRQGPGLEFDGHEDSAAVDGGLLEARAVLHVQVLFCHLPLRVEPPHQYWLRHISTGCGTALTLNAPVLSQAERYCTHRSRGTTTRVLPQYRLRPRRMDMHVRWASTEAFGLTSTGTIHHLTWTV
eukprot:3877620-Rhodomonas_salina.3